MSDSGFPVLVDGTWSSDQTKTVKNKLQIYFQSRKKSSGGECRVEVKESEPRAEVIFCSEEARVGVLARENHEITLGDRAIKLHLSPASCQTSQNICAGKTNNTKCGSEDIPSLNPASQDESKAQASAADEGEAVGVVLDNVSDSMSRDMLTLLVESISGQEADEFNLEIIPEVNKAVVTFNIVSDTMKFISNSKGNEKLEKRGLTVCPLEAPKSIRVENLPPSASNDILELYFDKVLALPEDITLIPDEQAAVLTFSDSTALRNVKPEYTINRTPVKVYPYYQSLDITVYGEDRPTWKMPESFTEKVHHVIHKFIVKNNLVNNINKQMCPYYCSVDMHHADVTLRPLPNFLRQKGLTTKQVENWKSTTLSAFRQEMAAYSAFECTANEAAWRESQEKVHSILKENGCTVMDTSRGVLTVAGHADTMKRVRASVEEVIKKAMSRIERKTNGITKVIDMQPAKYYILMETGLQTKTATYPELKLDYSNDKLLSVSGLNNEVHETVSWIFEKISNFSKKSLNLPSCIFEFLSTIDNMDLSRDLFTSHEISAFLSVENKQFVLHGACEKSIQDAEKKMKSDLYHCMLDVEDAAVLKLKSWKDLIQKILKTYNSSKKQTVRIMLPQETEDKVNVAGFRSPVNEVCDHLQEFLLNYSKVKETICVKSHAVVQFVEKHRFNKWADLSRESEVAIKFKTEQRKILLEGFRLNVLFVKSKLEGIAEGLLCDTLVLDKPGAKKYCQQYANTFLPSLCSEYKCAVVLQPDNQEEEEFIVITKEENVCFCKVKTSNGVLVSVDKADICSLNVDVIVNAANEHLQHIGGLALAILKAAGPKMQDISNDFISKNGNLQPGDAITTDPCNLPCKYVVHAVGPRFYQADRKTSVLTLERVVKESLKQAEKNNCKTVALPAISSGMFGFPVDLCAQTIAKVVREYCDRVGEKVSLKEIHLVDNTENTVKALAEAVNNEFRDLNPTMTLPLEERRGAVSKRYMKGGGAGHRSQQTQNERGARPKQPSREHLNAKRTGQGHRNAQSGSSEHNKHGRSSQRRLPTNAGDLNIILHEGNIQDQTTAVIVNTIDRSLNLSQGAVSTAILKAAGPNLQQCISITAGQASTQFGDVIITDAFNLKSQKVFHAICSHWDSRNANAEKELKSIIQDCLEKADQHEMPSIAFPAIGTGNLKYPRNVVSRILQQQIKDFTKTRKFQNLKDVLIVVHPSDQETVKCFRAQFEGQGKHICVEEETESNRPSVDPSATQAQQPTDTFGQVSSPSLGVFQIQMGPLSLEVLSGDITKEATDIIVNVSNPTFDLKSGVSKAVLEAAGSSVEKECQAIVSSPSYQGAHMILTSAGSLPSKHIIHVVGTTKVDLIKETVYKVLKLCEENHFSSISFPALGTGQGGVNPSTVAEAMTDAVVDFVRKKVPTHVHQVKILVFQAEMTTEFLKSLKKKEGEPVGEKSFFSKGLDVVKDAISHLIGITNHDKDSTGYLSVEREEFEPAVFQLCTDNARTLTLVKKKIEDMIVREQTSKRISDRYISQLGEEEIMQLKGLQSEMTIHIHLDKGTEEKEPHIHLEGLTRDVSSVESIIRELLRKVEREDNLRREAKLTADLVEWRYEQNTGTMATFDMFTNLKLEGALKSQKTIQIMINNKEYIADPVKKNAISITDQNLLELSRRDLKGEADLPSNWGDMKDGLVKRFLLTPNDQEYMDLVEKLKSEGFTGTINKIERVQNTTLWMSYQLLKKEMEKKNKNKKNEMILYHGTKSDPIDLINKQGFNRGYAGMQGAMYGNGCYFAVNPMYSYNYAKPDRKKMRCMYVARVLVGDFVKGLKGMITPPSKNTVHAADLYDSVVDNENNPTIHVVFNDIQAYPEYLLTFT